MVLVSVLRFLFDIITTVLFILALYYFLISLFSVINFGKTRHKAKELTLNSFAVVIPAHNEESVIAAAIESIKESNYPSELISVYVAADNCSDRTAEIAKKCGANVIRTSSSFGKGGALCEAFDIILKDDKTDCIAIIDADNITDTNFICEINEHLSSGAEVVQGYVDSKNPDSSLTAAAHSIWYWLENRLISLSKSKLGLSVNLYGTGFAIRSNILRKIPFPKEGLAEDLEYTLKLILSGIKIDWAHNAKVYDQKPDDFISSLRQRMRWAEGICDTSLKYTKEVLKAKKFGMTLLLKQSVLSPLCLIIFTVIYSMAIINLNIVALWTLPINFILLNIYIWGSLILMILAIIADGKQKQINPLTVLGFLIYIVTWLPIGIVGALRHKNKKWYHTEHKICQ